MTEIEMLKKENQLLKEQIELYKKLLEEKDKKKEYIPYPTYPNLLPTYPIITYDSPTQPSESWDNFIIKCKNGDA